MNPKTNSSVRPVATRMAAMAVCVCCGKPFVPPAISPAVEHLGLHPATNGLEKLCDACRAHGISARLSGGHIGG